ATLDKILTKLSKSILGFRRRRGNGIRGKSAKKTSSAGVTFQRQPRRMLGQRQLKRRYNNAASSKTARTAGMTKYTMGSALGRRGRSGIADFRLAETMCSAKLSSASSAFSSSATACL